MFSWILATKRSLQLMKMTWSLLSCLMVAVMPSKKNRRGEGDEEEGKRRGSWRRRMKRGRGIGQVGLV